MPEAVVRAEVAAAKGYAGASRAPATLRAYRADVRLWQAWCAARGIAPWPAAPAAVATWLAAAADAGRAPVTLGRRLAALGWASRERGEERPTARPDAGDLLRVAAGVRRVRARPPRKARAADAEILARMLAATPPDGGLRFARDRALLALGMAAALRRSELAALRVEDLERRPEGLVVRVRRSKTDQEGRGEGVPVPRGRGLRPVELLDAWLAEAGIESGPVFRPFRRDGSAAPRAMCCRGVARAVADAARRAGLGTEGFSGHSLRAGFVTAAARAGATVWQIRDVSRHRSVQTLAGYVREAEAFRNHAGAGFL